MKYRNLTLVQVQKLAATLGKAAAKTGVIIGLSGDLGSGKTTFTKALAKSLGIKSVKSPTFIVAARHRLPHQFLWHLDFYRLNETKQLQALGLTEILSGHNIVLIEWVEKFPQVKKICDILINLTVKPNNKRDVEIKFKK
ncbi:MAG: tRNA (adenosine(37)-N6)-threonylcarbamoyltransferase complex ATPase subunit type 1 TsaE [Candidatus Doudnabacteria bacterium]|nr:tRNA (adenosine(37)-N6)-threonylcarbamoyltransferase complex ATPase subunit type 1 TsaE [Candidatus Doudnabacteria bacterium]